MKVSSSLIELIKRKDKVNSLEVEHLLPLVHTKDKSLIESLQEIKRSHSWHCIENNMLQSAPERVVPFGTWVDIICDYFEGGIDRLVYIGKQKNHYSDFAIAILEELKTEESFEGLAEILLDCQYDDEMQLHTFFQAVKAINIVASFKNRPILSERVSEQVACSLLNFIDSVSERPQVEMSDNSCCILALRGIGSHATIQRLTQMTHSDFIDPSVINMTIKTIKKRIRQN